MNKDILLKQLIEKIKLSNYKSQTHFNNIVNYYVNENVTWTDEKDLLNLFELYVTKSHERFVDWEKRINEQNLKFPKLIETQLHLGQGFGYCNTWKGKEILKSAEDLNIINMLLWELKPNTVIEIGSGSGSSAEYIMDISKIYNKNINLFSFDIQNNNLFNNGINYLFCDCNNITTFENHGIDYLNLPHPWLIIEDTHCNVFEVVKYFNQYIKQGDYLIIEDAWTQQDVIRDLMALNTFLKLDTKYLDFFGYNNMSSMNGILKHV